MRTIPIAAALALSVTTGPVRGDVNWNELEQIFARQASQESEGVRRFAFPRDDIRVSVDGVKVEPGLALVSWLAFRPGADDQTLIMGDLVLTQEEVNPVLERLAETGIDVTALHNHLLHADPLPMYMHVKAQGDAVELAGALSDALGLTGTPSERSQQIGSEPELNLDTATISSVLGREGEVDGSVYKISIPRTEQITVDGTPVPPPMGTAIAINFQSAGDAEAATTGDFVLIAEEVNPVLEALRGHGIQMTALHNHMLEEEPRLFFMHFWGHGEPEELARGLRAALDQVAVQKN